MRSSSHPALPLLLLLSSLFPCPPLPPSSPLLSFLAPLSSPFVPRSLAGKFAALCEDLSSPPPPNIDGDWRLLGTSNLGASNFPLSSSNFLPSLPLPALPSLRVTQQITPAKLANTISFPPLPLLPAFTVSLEHTHAYEPTTARSMIAFTGTSSSLLPSLPPPPFYKQLSELMAVPGGEFTTEYADGEHRVCRGSNAAGGEEWRVFERGEVATGA